MDEPDEPPIDMWGQNTDVHRGSLQKSAGRRQPGARIGDGRAHPGKSPFVKGFTLTAQEREDLLNFLSSLTDERFLTDPRYSDPFQRSAQAAH